MKSIITIAAAAVALSAQAQVADVGSPVQITSTAAASLMAPRQQQVSVRTEGDTLYIMTSAGERVVHPVDCAGYIWASVSPDQTKVMFYAAAHGVYVTDLKGNVLATPGDFEAPVWLGNEALAAQRTTDDGHQISSSQIVLATLDGRHVQEVTAPLSMTEAPFVSNDATSLIYSTVDGILYQVSVTLK